MAATTVMSPEAHSGGDASKATENEDDSTIDENMRRLESVIGHAHDIEAGHGKLQDFRSATIKLQVVQDKAGGLTGSEKAMAKVKNKGIVSSSTVAANIMPGMNPFSADSQTVAILIRFRMKVFTLLVLQNVLVVLFALCIELVFQALNADGKRMGLQLTFLAWLIAVIALVVLTYVRQITPWNYIALLVFDICGAFALASVRLVFDKFDEPMYAPHLVCFGIHTLGIAALGLLSCKAFSGKTKRTCKTFLLSPIAIVFSNVLFVYVCGFFEVAPGGVVFAFAFLNTLGLLWIGYHIDKLSSLLTVDEYMQPIIVIWCELLVTILLFMAVAFFIFMACLGGGGDADADGCGDCCSGCTCCWLYGCSTSDDCFLHDNERERRDQRREEELAHRAMQQLEERARGNATAGEVGENLASGTAGHSSTFDASAGAAAAGSTLPQQQAPRQDVMSV